MPEANRVRIAYRAAGSTDNWKIFRRTGDALTAGAQTQRSDEIRDDRKRGGQKVTTITAGGTVDFEFSATSFDDFLAAGMCSAWVADTPTVGTSQLVVGTTTTKFDVLKSYLDEGRHVLLKDMEVGQLQFTMNSGAKITGQVTFMGVEVDEEYDPSTDTFDPAGTTLFMDSSNNLSSIMIDGAPVSGMAFTGMSITINNNHSSDQELGSQYQNHFKGSADITGTKTLRMSSAAFDLWKNTIRNVPISSSFTMSDGTTSYVFKNGEEYLSGDLPSGALDAILSMDLNYSVATDSTGEMTVIERT